MGRPFRRFRLVYSDPELSGQPPPYDGPAVQIWELVGPDGSPPWRAGVAEPGPATERTREHGPVDARRCPSREGRRRRVRHGQALQDSGDPRGPRRGRGALYAFTRGGKKGDERWKLVKVETGSITEKAVAVGQIQPRQKFQVKSKISGIVKVCRVQVGDSVKAGDPLFEIQPDPTPLELTEVDRRVESAQSSLNRAKVEFDRIRELAAQGVAPRSDVDVKREAFELATIALRKAEGDRDLTRRDASRRARPGWSR